MKVAPPKRGNEVICRSRDPDTDDGSKVDMIADPPTHAFWHRGCKSPNRSHQSGHRFEGWGGNACPQCGHDYVVNLDLKVGLYRYEPQQNSGLT